MQDTEIVQPEARQKIELLQTFIQSSIDDASKKKKTNQSKAITIKVLILCLSGGATIFLGLNLGTDFDVQIKNIAFALSSLVTVFNALEPFFNYRGLWVTAIKLRNNILIYNNKKAI